MANTPKGKPFTYRDLICDILLAFFAGVATTIVLVIIFYLI